MLTSRGVAARFGRTVASLQNKAIASRIFNRTYGILNNMTRRLGHPAVIDSDGNHAYGAILHRSLALRDKIEAAVGPVAPHASQPRIAYLAPRRHTYVAAKCATWLYGGIGVPLAEGYPADELEYVLTDSGASVVLVDPSLKAQVAEVAKKLRLPLIDVEPSLGDGSVPQDAGNLVARVKSAVEGRCPSDGAYFVYTSGTTGRPKGVVTTHASLAAQMHALCTAWEWGPSDRILHVLPLHHVHGILGVLLCALNVGATVTMLRKFEPQSVWQALAGQPLLLGGKVPVPAPTLFMAVPTVYSKLLQHYTEQEKAVREAWTAALQPGGSSAIRLMVSGSAALPEPVAVAWRSATGHALLERYGMTETGLALSNPLHGERRPNSVGFVLPGYEARIVDEASPAAVTRPGEPGQLLLRGTPIFKGYWNRPDATAESFTPDGWYKTGDLAVVDADGYYHILGRMSADIIKSGGYKISALEIERILLECPEVHEIAVFGVADPVWGERVAALVVPKGFPQAVASAPTTKPGSVSSEPTTAGNWTEDATSLALRQKLRQWAGDKLAPYKLPSIVRVLSPAAQQNGGLPRNAMGKVNKKALRAEFFGTPK